jgi:aspartate carbamoyltransferase catalytic subunit
MATLFYTISTRTRLSFESAMLRLGGQVISTESPQSFSDTALGGSLEDTVRMVGSYSDVIVLRHPEEGSARRASKVSGVPIVNAGDGGAQHPTQALLDLYTIYRAIDGIDGVSVVVMGDLANSRTARSLCYFLGKYTGIRLWLVSPRSYAVRRDMIEYLERHQVAYTQVFSPGEELREALGKADVVYQTDLPEDIPQEPGGLTASPMDYRISGETLPALRKNAVILHPFPRVYGIAPEVDSDPRALYFRQIANGLYIRMALLRILLLPEYASQAAVLEG